MAAPAVTYTFSNSTTADATQVNQNFTDIINGLTDGSKDLSIAALTVAGNASFSGNTTIGNSSGDDLILTASLASSIPVKTTNTYDIGSSSLGLRALYFGANSQTVNVKASASASATWTLTLPVDAGTNNYVLSTNGSGVTSWRDFQAATVQTFLSGSGTYNTPAGAKYLRVRMVGGGSGGSGGGSSGGGNGLVGGDTTFGSNTASGGAGVAWSSSAAYGAVGGAVSVGTGTQIVALAGARGACSQLVGGGRGGDGGNSPFGGAGIGGFSGSNVGLAATANSGSGGGGGGSSGAVATGRGGASGGYIEVMITSPAGSYSYSVGTGGSGGGAGTSGQAGAAGGSGIIIVEEFYQ